MGTCFPETLEKRNKYSKQNCAPSWIQGDKYQCRIDIVISPDDGHMVARNMYRRAINILSRILHLVGFI